MLKLASALKPYYQTGSLNEHINLFGFIDHHAFLTKSGHVGCVLASQGVDYEGLDSNGIDNFTKRLESALKLFDNRWRIYQYLCKHNAPEIAHRTYSSPILSAAIENRIAYLEGKADRLYSVALYFVVILENPSREKSFLRAFRKAVYDKQHSWRELKAALSIQEQGLLLGEEIHGARTALDEKVSSFLRQVNDFLTVEVLDKQEAFRFLKRTLNFDRDKLNLARLKHDTFLDYYLCESHLECHRRFLRVDDFYVKVLTLKEPSSQSFPLIFQKLLEIRANFFIVTEWKKEDPDKTRLRIHSRRRHFHNTKRSLVSYLNTSSTPAAPEDILIDDSKEAQVHSLGRALSDLEVSGTYFGEFSLTVVVYDLDRGKVDAACAEFYKVFSVHDAQLYEERYNLLNAYLSAVPGNSALNLRRIFITNANYADYSFLFSIQGGEPENHHLAQEYLAVLETRHHTPYYFNLHHGDIANTVILGRSGSGKSFLLNFLITNVQKYEPYTFIFDLGGSFESLTHLFGGSYLRLGLESHDFKINPFALPPSKRNLDFLSVFVRVLAEPRAMEHISSAQEKELFEQIQNLYELDDRDLRTLSTLGNTLRRDLDNRLSKWKQGGQFGFLFDNVEDSLSFSRFQCFDFQGLREYPQLLEPLLFYVLYRADAIIREPKLSHVFKAFFIDEAWVFLKHPSIRLYILEALKTWRKHNAALVLSTQSLDELQKSEILDVILESCVTKIFLANPDMDRELYQRRFHLNDHEIELIAGLVPKQGMLIKTPETSKVAHLNVDAKSYWLYTNDPFDNRKRDQAFSAHGFAKGLEVLASARADLNYTQP